MKKYTVTLGAALMATTAGVSAANAEDMHMIMCGDDTTPGIAVQADLISEWEAANPNYDVVVEFVPWGQCQEKSMTLAAAGNPAALAYLGSRTLKQLAQNDLIVPVNLTEEEAATYAAPILGTVTWNDQQWGLPRAFSSKALWYNRGLFEEAGLDPETPPTTWEELLTAAKAITENTEAAGYGLAAASFDNTMHQFMTVIYSNGGEVINSDGEIVFNSENNVQALQFVADIVEYAEPGPVAYDRGKLETLFAEQQIGMLIDGHWLTGRVAEDVNMDVVPFPAGPMGASSSLLITDSLAIFNGSGMEDAALSLAKMLTNPANQMSFDIAEGYTPIRTGPEVDALIAGDATWSPFIDVIPAGGPEPFVTDYVAMQDILNEAIQGVVLGEVDAAEAVEYAAEELESVK
ncbi:ABC transporter substrate-binding protein [Loktanella sp. D2R18]|uniref:ABC transporter substrate-binding protein n=1 Tax=Rhodobacterales TaxID=204455 RepID=UPI000DE9E2A4|nr:MULTISPECIES: sugar ABC transporter substrate-binding protein [Rhodobacterales]MDO6591897.1 sugar ABC transporter substrate-binding protein [Yoonia sp. 1_MG-2023]RBW42672.1 ABC transporter substrate-binding protein [Loktanella sp. D2R18]